MKTELGYLSILFGDPNYDWMNFKVTDENKLTFHHIKREWEGGETFNSNGALLTDLAHKYLHAIELNCPTLYNELNLFFTEVNKRRYSPTEDELALIEEELLNYEYQYKKRLKKSIQMKFFNENKIILLYKGNGNTNLYNPTNIRLNLKQGINIYNEGTKKKYKKKIN